MIREMTMNMLPRVNGKNRARNRPGWQLAHIKVLSIRRIG